MPLDPFDQLDQSLQVAEPGEALDQLAATLADREDFRGVLDAMLLRARLDLGLPLVQPGSISDLPEPTRTLYEERYVEAIRKVGGLLLGAGEIGTAWTYFRAIGEKEPVHAAIEDFNPGDDDGERLGEVIEVALSQGVHPQRGFDLILNHHGTCSALTAFDALPPDEPTRRHAATRLAHRLHDDLLTNLRAELTRHQAPVPSPGAPIREWLEGPHDWQFEDDAYHLDTSHLAMVVRLSPLLTEPSAIRLALGLTDYGRKLSPRLQTDGEPPFDDFHADHALYLSALLGENVEAAIDHFRSRLGPPDPTDREAPIRAQTLVRLLDRLGRTSEAFEVATQHLGHLTDGALGEPSLVRLGVALGRLDQLAEVARTGDDPVRYTAIRLEQKRLATNGHGRNTDQTIKNAIG